MADQLMHDPVTGTQYYASEAGQSAAYYAQLYGPAYQEAAKEAQAVYYDQLAQGVAPQTAVDVALAKHNPDAATANITPAKILAESTPVALPTYVAPPPSKPFVPIADQPSPSPQVAPSLALAAAVAAMDPGSAAHAGQETHAQTEIRKATGVDIREPVVKPPPAPDVTPTTSTTPPTTTLPTDHKANFVIPAAAVAAAWFLL